jgi:hypothetical protein
MTALPTPRPYDNNTESKNIENQTYGTGNNYRLSNTTQLTGEFEMIEIMADDTVITEHTGKDSKGVEYNAGVHHNILNTPLGKGEVYRATGKYTSITLSAGVVNIIR